ncbi:MAG TPA: hypothetical protein VGQ65_13280 [Thermoanaerobaculia bacterium]|jgi:hypothetical protein|nr:hypothetical protein [Thermoanaerobaculia bacterium]
MNPERRQRRQRGFVEARSLFPAMDQDDVFAFSGASIDDGVASESRIRVVTAFSQAVSI